MFSDNKGCKIFKFYDNIEDIKLSIYDKLIRNVTWYIKDDMLYVEGFEDELHFTEDIIYLDELKYRPREKDIKIYNELKLFGFKLFDKREYVKNTYIFPGKNKIKIIVKGNFVIKDYSK
jgi:hypothetical protein